MLNKSYNQFNLSFNVFTNPIEAIEAIGNRPSSLYPLFVILLSTALVRMWFFNIQDLAWSIDNDLAEMAQNQSDLDVESVRELLENLSGTVLMLMAVFLKPLSLLASFILSAGYYSLASAIVGSNYKFRHWFSLTCWATFPYLFVLIGTAVNILLNPNGQISSAEINPLSLSSLGIQLNDYSLQNIVESVSLTIFWTIALLTMAYKHWHGTSLFKALMAILPPYVIYFGFRIVLAVI